LTTLAKILNGDGMKQMMLKPQVNKQGTSCSNTRNFFPLSANWYQQIVFVIFH
jgi:hypothetical protein